MIKGQYRVVISFVRCGAEGWNWGKTHQELKEIGNILLRFRNEFIILILILCFIICITCILLHISNIS